MIIKSTSTETPQHVFGNQMPKIQTSHTKYHVIRPDKWFLDTKQVAKQFSGLQKVCIDIDSLSKEYKFPVALMIFKAMYKLQSYKTKPTITTLFILNQPEIVSILQSLLIGSDLATEPANKLYPEKFCKTIVELFKTISLSPGLTINIKWFDEHDIKKNKLNLVDAVGKGAQKPPRFLIIELQNKYCKDDPIALVGKGVVFDSGGYNLKPGSSMITMKGDKTGASIVVSIIHYFAKQSNPKNLIGIIPLVENMISHKATKIGDIITAYNGKTVEILNTDAEGRLILADSLAYVSKNYSTKLILDFATLTGWANILHCDTSFVFFTTNDKLGKTIETYGNRIGERNLRLPNWPEYIQYTKSEIADYKNVNFECGRSDGFMASMFLMNFVKDPSKWVHFDVTHSTNAQNMHFVNSAATAIKLISERL